MVFSIGLFTHSSKKKSSSKPVHSSLKEISLRSRSSKKLLKDTDAHNSGYYSSNHVLVNRERARAGYTPFQRSRFLDSVAEEHAKWMASQNKVFHSVDSVQLLQLKLSAAEVGENVLCGESIRDMHQDTMDHFRGYARKNIMSPKFTEFGMGTAMGEGGKLYMVQLFRGSNNCLLEL